MDRHASTLSTDTVAAAAAAGRALAQAFAHLPSSIDAEIAGVWARTGDPTTSTLKMVPVKDASAHGVLALAAHQKALLDAVRTWAAHCPLLWGTVPQVKTHGTTDDSLLYLVLRKGKVAELRLILDNPLVRSPNMIAAKLGPKGVELLRFATLVASVQGPLQAWTSMAGNKSESYHAGDQGTAALVDRLIRSATSVLKTGKANTPAGMRYTTFTTPVDAQAVLDHVLKT